MSNPDFEQFLEQRSAAAEACATFHSPRGDTVSGAAAVAARYRKTQAKPTLKSCNENRAEIPISGLDSKWRLCRWRAGKTWK
jgi:hypothetical protein